MNGTYSREEELENAIEALLECFDRSGQGRAWIEVEVDMSNDAYSYGNSDSNGIVIADGQVNQITADAIAIAEEVLYHEEIAGGYEIE